MMAEVQIDPTEQVGPQTVPVAYPSSIGCRAGLDDWFPMEPAHPAIAPELAAFAASVEASASRLAPLHRPSAVAVSRPPRRAEAKTSQGYLWALAPLLSLGLAAVPCFVFAARRLRSRTLYVAVAVYSVLTVLMVWGGSTDSQTSLQSDVGTVACMTLMTLSTVHALMVRRTLFVENGYNDGAVAIARARMRQREQARRIATKDPTLARELMIGRPDRSSPYDDGGLVDVNHVPVCVLCTIEGIDPELATAIVDVRESVRRFNSREDLESTLGLDPYRLDSASDLLVFLH